MMDKGSHNSNERICNTPIGRTSESLSNLLGKKQRHFLIVSGDKWYEILKEMIRIIKIRVIKNY